MVVIVVAVIATSYQSNMVNQSMRTTGICLFYATVCTLPSKMVMTLMTVTAFLEYHTSFYFHNYDVLIYDYSFFPFDPHLKK